MNKLQIDATIHVSERCVNALVLKVIAKQSINSFKRGLFSLAFTTEIILILAINLSLVFIHRILMWIAILNIGKFRAKQILVCVILRKSQTGLFAKDPWFTAAYCIKPAYILKKQFFIF